MNLSAVCTEETNQRSDNELKMRVRVIAQTFTDLWRHRSMTQSVSQWPLRRAAPFPQSHALHGAVLSDLRARVFSHSGNKLVCLSNSLCFAGLGYLCAAFSWLLEKVGVRSRVLALPHYFVLANLASMIALFKFLRGERYARWEPIR